MLLNYNIATMYVIFMLLWGNNMVKNGFQDEIKDCSTRVVFDGKSLEKLDGCTSHCWC